MVEITTEEQNKLKRIKRAEDSLRDLQDHIKCTNLRIIGYEKICEEIIFENFSNIEKEIANQVQEA